MGFSTLIDILGATLVGGMVLLILLRLNDAAVENSFIYGGEYIVQSNLVEIVELVEYDFRKIGFCADWTQIPDPSKAIISADTSSIAFLTDLNSDGIVDTLKYYTGPASELPGTPNPNDKKLYRVENHQTPGGSNLGVTRFNISYFNVLGDTLSTPVAQPGEIYTMQIDIVVEDVYYGTEDDYDVNKKELEYSSAFWRQIRLAARNLRNR